MSLVEHSKLYQREVYKFAGELIQKYDLNSYLDIGCGYPSKIEEFIYPHTKDITGLDLPEVIDQTKEVRFGTWKIADLEKGFNLERKFDLIVSADVIEHLHNPIKLLDSIKSHCTDETYIIISTPDGNTTIKEENGGPANGFHVQEWGTEEFVKFLITNGFEVLERKSSIEDSNPNAIYTGNHFLCRKLKEIKILVSVPCLHWIHKHVVHKLMLLQCDQRYKLNIILPSHKPFENNLHHIVKDFMDGDYDYWLSMDSDNPPMVNPLNLIELDKDIIGLPTPVWHFENSGKKERPVVWNAYDYVPKNDAYREHTPQEGLQEVDAIGTGCFIIARRVFENPEMRKKPFERKLYPDGRVNKGNDISFCERAKAQGFKIYAHFDYPCDHFSELSLNENVRAWKNLYEKESPYLDSGTTTNS